MSGTSLDTLFLPLENGDVQNSSKTLFLGAAHHVGLKRFKDVDLYQPFKPLADGLLASDYKVLSAVPEGQKYDLILVHIPKQADEARGWLAIAAKCLNEGGVLMAAAANDSGGGRMHGWMKELGFETQSLSKHKARVVWGVRPKQLSDNIIEGWEQKAAVKTVDYGEGIKFKSQAGLFSWNSVDDASFLLSEFLPKDLIGHGADFGSGLGYLTYGALNRPNVLKSIALVEADSRALECSKINLENVREQTELSFHWHDFAKPLVGLPPLDFAIMNPPFHSGAKNDIGLGKLFVQNAAHHIKKRGALYMVANVHLPYEDVLKSCFSSFEIITQKNGFKVIRGIK